MIRSYVNHVHPVFIFLIWNIVFISVGRVSFYLKKKYSTGNENREIARLVVSIISGFFSIFLGFLIFLLWNEYAKARAVVIDETSKLYVIWEISKGFSPPITKEVDNNLKNYVRLVINEEWADMARGEENPQAKAALEKLYHTFTQYTPDNTVSQLFLTRAIFSLNDAVEFRNHRIAFLTPLLPLAWYIMIIIGSCVIIVISIYSLKNHIVNHMAHTVLCVFLSFYLTAITLLYYPFADTTVSIKSYPFQNLLATMETDV